MYINTSEWIYFRIDDLFTIKKGKRLIKADMNEGPTPFIAAIEDNNGLRQSIDVTPIHSGNTITVNYNGSVGEAFYQKEPFYASDDVNILYPKFEMNERIALFIVTVIRKEQYRFNYGRKWKSERMGESTIKLPSTPDGSPDFTFMDRFIADIWPSQINTDPICVDVPLRPVKYWKDFRYSDIFVIRKGYYNKKPQHEIEGSIPFLGATENDNGMTDRYSYEDIFEYNRDGTTRPDDISKKLFEPNCIAVVNNGSAIGYAYYQNERFTCSHDVNPLYLKNHELNPYIAMFLITVIKMDSYRWNYGRKWRPKRMVESTIRLPVDDEGNPDYDYMESFIKSLSMSRSL